MLEWLKRHVWKACDRPKRFQGSNPCLSATKKRFREAFTEPFDFFIYALFLTKTFPYESCECTADERSADEDVEVLESLAAYEDGRTERTCRVDGSTCKVDAYEVDEDE